MDLLKDLPSFDRDNFSKYSQGSWKAQQGKSYFRLRNDTDSEDKAQVIVMDTTSLLLRDLEREVRRRKRASLKRGPMGDDKSRKVPRIDTDSDEHTETLD